jgi:hypothetical protein
MTKNELKNIIKGLIIESINESKSKNFVSSKKTKKLKEQDEMEPVHPQASAEPDAGEVEGPEVPETAEEHEHAELLTQIDGIIGSLNGLKANLLGHAEGEEVEQSSDVQESSDEDLDDEDLDDEDDDNMKNMLSWQKSSAKRLGYADTEEEDDFEKKLSYTQNVKKPSTYNFDKMAKKGKHPLDPTNTSTYGR